MSSRAGKRDTRHRAQLGPERERLATYGASGLSDRELLALLVGAGTPLSGNVYALVERLLARYGRVRAIAQAHPADLTRVTGIGPATATRMAAAFELARRVGSGTEQRDVITSAYDIAVAVWPLLRGCTRERVVVVICNRVNRVLGHEILSIGSAVKALLPIREAIAAVLRRDGHSFALAHNHPSGDPTPSAYDMRATGQVERAADATGLRLISHVVVTDHAWRTVFTPLAGRDGARVEGGDLP